MRWKEINPTFDKTRATGFPSRFTLDKYWKDTKMPGWRERLCHMQSEGNILNLSPGKHLAWIAIFSYSNKQGTSKLKHDIRGELKYFCRR